jgi:uncharacterized membrane protein (DUF373 family)
MPKEKHDHNFLSGPVKITDIIVHIFIFLAILVLLIFTGKIIYQTFIEVLTNGRFNILHQVALIIVLVKAYRLLLFYLESHHVSIKFIIEIAIIAPAVEIIFAASSHDLATNILFGLFSLGNLIVYLIFYKTLSSMDDACLEDEVVH